MSNDQVDDLKQFIDSRFSQFEVRFTSEFTALRQDMNNGFTGIAEIIEGHNDQLDNHEQRLTKLETKVA